MLRLRSIPLFKMFTTNNRFLKYVFAFSMFLTALAYIVFLTTEIHSGFDELPTSQTVYNVHTKIPDEVNWTGAQVVGKLYRLTEDNVPIVVNGMTFSTDVDVMNKQNLIDLHALYNQAVEYDANGKIVKITFTVQ